MAKYKNKKCEFNGLKFDSLVERARYIDLLDMQRCGLISELTTQPRFILFYNFARNGKKYRATEYVADFQYIENDRLIVCDVKGMKTDAYKLKLKRFLFLNPLIIFREVTLFKNKWEILEL